MEPNEVSLANTSPPLIPKRHQDRFSHFAQFIRVFNTRTHKQCYVRHYVVIGPISHCVRAMWP